MHRLSAAVELSPKSSTWVTRPATVSYEVAVDVVRQDSPAPSSREVQVFECPMPVKLAVIVPQERVFLAVWWYQGRLTVLVRILPPLPE